MCGRGWWTHESKRHFDNSVWSAFSQVKVDPLVIWKRYSVLTHSMVRIHLSCTDFVVTLIASLVVFFFFFFSFSFSFLKAVAALRYFYMCHASLSVPHPHRR